MPSDNDDVERRESADAEGWLKRLEERDGARHAEPEKNKNTRLEEEAPNHEQPVRKSGRLATRF